MGEGEGVLEGVGVLGGVVEGVSEGVVEGVVSARWGKEAEAVHRELCEGGGESVGVAAAGELEVEADALEERMGEAEEKAEGAPTRVGAAVAGALFDAALVALEKGLGDVRY